MSTICLNNNQLKIVITVLSLLSEKLLFIDATENRKWNMSLISTSNLLISVPACKHTMNRCASSESGLVIHRYSNPIVDLGRISEDDSSSLGVTSGNSSSFLKSSPRLFEDASRLFSWVETFHFVMD